MTEQEFLLELEHQDRPAREVRGRSTTSFLTRLRALRVQGAVELVQGEETSLRITGAGRALLARLPGIRQGVLR